MTDLCSADVFTILTPRGLCLVFYAMLCCVCMRSRVNRFNYPNKTGGQSNKAAEKKEKEKRSLLCAQQGVRFTHGCIYINGDTNVKKSTCITLVSVVTL